MYLNCWSKVNTVEIIEIGDHIGISPIRSTVMCITEEQFIKEIQEMKEWQEGKDCKLSLEQYILENQDLVGNLCDLLIEINELKTGMCYCV